MKGTPPLLEAEHISHRYHHRPVLEDISLSLERGHVLALLGPNGAGKSTLLQILAGLFSASSGTVRIDGKKYRGQPELARRIGWLPATPALYPDLTTHEQLEFVARLHGLDAAEAHIEKALQACELESVARRRVGHLSKGFQQRIGLAQALLHDPEILLLDEPGDGLDPIQLQALHELLAAHQSEIGTILSSHNLGEVETLCDDLLVIDQGRCRYRGRLDALDEPLPRAFKRLIHASEISSGAQT